MLPGLGPSVTGASWTPYDGHANSLQLFHALHRAFAGKGGTYLPNRTVTEASVAPRDFRISFGEETIGAPDVVLAAGLGNAKLAPVFGLSAPVRPQRGQILVDRADHAAPGRSRSAASARPPKAPSCSAAARRKSALTPARTRRSCRRSPRRAVLSFPWLADLQIVRAWAALRVMPPDGLPIYDESERFPGAFTANCHSGVTLAGAHANLFAPMVRAGALDPMLAPFSAKRFDVPAAA